MEFHDYPLLSYQDLMLTVLQTAARGRATLQECLARLRHTLAAANERPPVSAADMLQRLNAAKVYLAEAMLLTPLDGNGFAITARGRSVLAEHPMGVDDTVLMQFPEFRRFILRTSEPPSHDDPRDREYEEGYEAYCDGKPPTENPYEFDRIEHLAWENGWFTARDDDTAAQRR